MTLYVGALYPAEKTILEDRYEKKSSEGPRSGKWKLIEEQALLAAVKKCGELWEKVSEELNGTRTPIQCFNKWEKRADWNCFNQKKIVRKGKWLKEEDQKLRESVKEHGENWPLVCKKVNRLPKQCFIRWETLHWPASFSDEQCRRLASLGNDRNNFNGNERNWLKIADEFKKEEKTDIKYSPYFLRQTFRTKRIQEVIKNLGIYPPDSISNIKKRKFSKEEKLSKGLKSSIKAFDQRSRQTLKQDPKTQPEKAAAAPPQELTPPLAPFSLQEKSYPPHIGINNPHLALLPESFDIRVFFA